MHLNKLYIYNDYVYHKIPEFYISYKKKYSLLEFYEQFDNIALFFQNNFKTQFDNFNFYQLKIDFLLNVDLKEKLKHLSLLFSNKIQLNFNLIEFSDGIFNLKKNQFLKKKDILKYINGLKLKNEDYLRELDILFGLSVATTKFSNRTYKNLGLPKIWLSQLKAILSLEDLETIFFFIANIFTQSDDDFKKRRVLYVCGETNTKKTTLLATPLLNFFGNENVGFLTTSTNFCFQELVGKKFGLFDEFAYQTKYKKDLLKLFEGQLLKVDIKFKNPTYVNETGGFFIIIISNELIDETKEKNAAVLRALKNRLNEVIFSSIAAYEEDIEKKLIEEELEIIIFCVKYFFKKKFGIQKIRNSDILTFLI